jgi:hypothetical protein
MRRPTRTPFHHSDLGGPFVAFARGFHECDEKLKGEADSSHPLFIPTRHQRSSVLSRLIDALWFRRVSGGMADEESANEGVNPPRRPGQAERDPGPITTDAIC